MTTGLTRFASPRQGPLPLLTMYCLACCCGCNGDVTIDVQAYGFPANVGSFEVSTALPGRPGSPQGVTVSSNRPQFLLDLPEHTSGELMIQIYGLDAAGCIVAHGGTQIPVVGPGPYRADVLLGQAAGCQVAAAVNDDAALLSVWGSAANDVWAVGDRTVQHWDGTGWAFVDLGTPESFLGVWGSAANDVWVVGTNGAVRHWDGAAWAPVAAGTTQHLLDVWGSGPSDVWAVGNGDSTTSNIRHWDGVAWAPVDSGTTNQLATVWGSGPNDVWALTSDGLSMVHWNGVAWTPTGSFAGVHQQGLWGSGPDDIWVVGYSLSKASTERYFNTVSMALHWDGSSWTAIPTGAAQMLQGVWGSGRDDVWAVGDSGIVLHWNGSVWFTIPSSVPDSHKYNRIWGSGPHDVWVVGDFGAVAHFRL